MPNLSLHKLVRYEPSIPGNRQSERPFFIMVKSGVSKEELAALPKGWGAVAKAKDPVEAMVKLFGQFVEIGDEPLSLAGKPVKSLRDYLAAVSAQPGTPFLTELSREVLRLNSVEGIQEVFFGRPHGSSGSTVAPNADKAGVPTGG